ncbi:winged helix-turn-helix transcriptional regulator [Bacillus infantis]|uniref:winged helix-turn-helix transcriptional regulator n=1 Tax=Bacillus infantis TaxID=324767 RepID=UPI001F1171AF|nr:hypothetical protein [Bacillus infantis]MCR6609131.1 hypothetical protein [Bacillus infantis]
MKYDVIGKVNRNKCPLTHALNMIGGKWRLPIIWALWNHETMRYNELKNEVEGIQYDAFTSAEGNGKQRPYRP